ncbi:MAG: hypothetical protein Kow0077_26380 [Anaerolineae bacterium]
MHRIALYTLLTVSLALLVGLACTPGAVAQTATPSPSPSPSPTPDGWIGPYTYPPGVNPLTGLPVDDPAMLALRPVAVKISNAPPIVRPQNGIGQADVVFEHYTEGGLTRFTAVFLSQLPRRVGSVRSARLIDVEIPEMFESYLVYAGSSGGVRERIEASAFAERAFYGVETGPPAYYRDPAIPVPHNLFADLIAVHELAAERGVNTPPAPEYSALAFAPDPPFPGEPASTIDLRYRASGVYWQYDDEAGVYYRWSDGQPHFDRTLDRQVSAANVVVLYVHHVEDPTIVESEYQGSKSYSIQIQFWHEGDAIVFRDGQAYRARWERPIEHYYDMFVLRDENGDFMRLKPGVTFFHFVPLDFDALTWE